jgi:F-type H+-transporting ATPase subunit gamma
MPTAKEYNQKLAQLRNTRKMTKTMKMVSANKLRKAQEAQRGARRFAERVGALLAHLVAEGGDVHPLAEPREAVREVLLLLVTSDKGLCGGFNNNLARRVAAWIAEQEQAGRHVSLSFHGRRGWLYFRRRPRVQKYYEGASALPSFRHARRIALDLQATYLSERYDEVHLAYNAFVSPMTQTPRIERYLPLDLTRLGPTAGAKTAPPLYAPDRAAVAGALAPRWANLRLHDAMLESAAGEHGARMTAMDNSTSNADSLIESYTLRRNRARQAAITRELTEIVAGAEALK